MLFILTDPKLELEKEVILDLGCLAAKMAEATIRHLTSPAFITGVAAGAACAALYVRSNYLPPYVSNFQIAAFKKVKRYIKVSQHQLFLNKINFQKNIYYTAMMWECSLDQRNLKTVLSLFFHTLNFLGYNFQALSLSVYMLI